MPLTRITSQLISIPSNYPLTGSLNGTASYATTASFAMNGGSGGGGGTTSLTGITFPYVSGSNTYTLSQSAVAANDLLLSVNGVVQTPTTDYTVSASSVTFTDSYPSGSSVNVRYLVTATSSSFVDLANIVLTGTTTGDAYYPQVAALLHFDGTNGSTTITDNSKNNLAFTVNGDSKISTAQSKFGGSSLLLDGTGDYISSPSTSDLAFGTGDFTIEFWMYSSDVSSATQRGVFQTSDTAGGLKTTYTTGVLLAQGLNGSTANLNGGLCVNVCGTFLGSSVAVVSVNTWYHIAIVRNSGTSTLYVNGTSVGSATTTGNCSGTYLAIGGYYNTSYLYQGYIDELRITNGYARYTGAFTPPTAAFSNTGGDVGKALVVNSTATGVSIGTAGYFSSQLAKAWVNFNGTGTVAIRDSYNVSSITDNGTGNYTVNYSTAFPNANYCVNASVRNFSVIAASGGSITTTGVTINTNNASMTSEDTSYVFVSIFSN
jgi:hypothetical protein